MIRKITQTAFCQPDAALSRNRSVMMCHRTIRYATKAKMTTVYQMKSQNESHIWSLLHLGKETTPDGPRTDKSMSQPYTRGARSGGNNREDS